MSMMFGTISYLPDDLELRKIRIQAHKKQCDWVDKNLYDTFKLGVYQNWTRNELEWIPSRKIFKSDYGIGPSNARNKILDYFYYSSYDWLMLCDDDSFLYDYYDPRMFLEELSETDKFKDLGIIIPINPMIQPFKNYNNNPAMFDKYVLTKASVWNGCQVAFIPNLVKRSKSPIYFSEAFYEKYKSYEDILFCMKWVKEGNTLHNLQSLIMYYGEGENSSIYGLRDVSKKNRLSLRDDGIRGVARELQLQLINRTGTLSIDTTKLFNQTPTLIVIPRREPIKLSENLAVKPKNTTHKLF